MSGKSTKHTSTRKEKQPSELELLRELEELKEEDSKLRHIGSWGSVTRAREYMLMHGIKSAKMAIGPQEYKIHVASRHFHVLQMRFGDTNADNV